MEKELTGKIENKIGYVDFLTRLTHRLAAHCNYDGNMCTALEMIGEYLHYDRVHIVEVRNDMTLAVLYEWHTKELPFVDYKIKTKEVLSDKHLVEQLYRFEYITISEADENVNPKIKEQLAYQNGKNMILFPLIESGSHCAFIAFVQCSQIHDWVEEEIKMMESVASVVGTSLHKKRLIDKLYRHLVLLKKNEQKALALRAQLNSLNEELQPMWQQFKDHLKYSEINETESHTEKIDKHIYTLDRLCRVVTVK